VSSVQDDVEVQDAYVPITDEDKERMAIDNQYINVGNDRITPDTLTRFEVARLVGMRARIIELTGQYFCSLDLLPEQ
jgi:hypothetical protein